MASLNEISYNLLNIARGGLSSDDDRLNIRQIKFWIRYYRSWAIFNETSAGKNIDNQLVQDLGCLSLESVDKANCPEILWGCNVKRIKIPKLVYLPDDRALVFIGLADKVTPILLSDANIISFKKHQKFTGGMRRAYFIGGYLYIDEAFSDDIEKINVRGVFENPSDISVVNADGTISCLDDDSPYPISEYMIPIIIQNIMSKELNMVVKAVNDEVNDNRESNFPVNESK